MLQPLVEFLTQKGIRIKNVEKEKATRTSGLQEAEIQTDEDDDDYGGEESETGTELPTKKAVRNWEHFRGFK